VGAFSIFGQAPSLRGAAPSTEGELPPAVFYFLEVLPEHLQPPVGGEKEKEVDR